MWKALISYFTRVFTLAEKVQQHDRDIKEIREELNRLSAQVQDIAFELKSLRAENRHDFEKLVLRIENEFLRFEKRLPAPRSRKSSKD